MVTDDDRKIALNKALDLLSRREHAAKELKQKLLARGFEVTVVDGVLEYLLDKRYLNDVQFAQSFLRMRVEKGFGERDIRAVLAERGVDREAIQAAFSTAEIDWQARALAALTKKFRRLSSYNNPISPTSTTDQRCSTERDIAREKGARFLQARGFTAEQAFTALDNPTWHDAQHDNSNDTQDVLNQS